MAKKCYILGGGESGTGAAILAKKQGYEVFLSDRGSLHDAYKSELKSHGIFFEEGQHDEEKILQADEIDNERILYTGVLYSIKHLLNRHRRISVYCFRNKIFGELLVDFLFTFPFKTTKRYGRIRRSEKPHRPTADHIP